MAIAALRIAGVLFYLKDKWEDAQREKGK